MTTETTPIDKMLQETGMEDKLVKYVNQVKGNAWNSPQNCRVGKRYRLLISTLPIAEGVIVSNKECTGDCNVQNLHGSYSYCDVCSRVIQ